MFKKKLLRIQIRRTLKKRKWKKVEGEKSVEQQKQDEEQEKKKQIQEEKEFLIWFDFIWF